jgi:hypothetical protein
MNLFRKLTLIIILAGLFGSPAFARPLPNQHKTLTSPHKDDWVKLFDSESLKGWHTFNGKVPIKNWTVVNGALVCLGAAADAKGGDIVTDKQFANFELSWDWKIENGTNSGIIYHVVESPKNHTTYET